MGGTSVPTLLFRIAAIGKESIGTEVPPTKEIPPTKIVPRLKAGAGCDSDGRRRRSHRRSRPGAAA
ncbi:DUF6053 domain-containing protein [Lysobacter enzymogenes]|uniref:DUF6053 domain-containing protein n=1 Tax=Lysobacter enzymogenes TaxID=69 RepID=UPI0033989B21